MLQNTKSPDFENQTVGMLQKYFPECFNLSAFWSISAYLGTDYKLEIDF
jgi:hypothetical protein